MYESPYACPSPSTVCKEHENCGLSPSWRHHRGTREVHGLPDLVIVWLRYDQFSSPKRRGGCACKRELAANGFTRVKQRLEVTIYGPLLHAGEGVCR